MFVWAWAQGLEHAHPMRSPKLWAARHDARAATISLGVGFSHAGPGTSAGPRASAGCCAPKGLAPVSPYSEYKAWACGTTRRQRRAADGGARVLGSGPRRGPQEPETPTPGGPGSRTASVGVGMK